MARPPGPHRHALAVGLVAGGLIAGCAPSAPRIPSGAPGDVPRSITVRQAGRVTVVPLEDYVLGTALSEVTPVGQSPAVATRVFEVQAIIARTYAAANRGRHRSEGFDLCDTTHCQLYEPRRIATSSFTAAAQSAVAHTAGRILRFRGRPAETVFHADCGGSSTTPADAWGGPALSYLIAAPDSVPGVEHRRWRFSASTREWTAILNGNSSTRIAGSLRDLRVMGRDASGRVATVEIVGNQAVRVTGSLLRQIVSDARGPRALMSTLFDIRRTSEGFQVDGSGFGHGVGLCQVGTIARARRGDTVEAILAHYYPGTR